MNQANQKRPAPLRGEPSRPSQGNNRPASRVAGSQVNGQVPRKPSYLSQVKTELLDFIATRLPNTDESGIQEFTDEVWALLQPKIVESYWNGVSAGASGRVKPKAQRPQPASQDEHNS